MNATPTSEFPRLLELAAAEAQAGTQELIAQYQLQDFPSVSLDLHVGRLNFSNDVRFDIQVVGRFDANNSVWQWAWCDPTIPPQLARAAAHARGFGQANEILPLTVEFASAREDDCWRWTAFATRLVKWPAMYRMPLENGQFLFLSFRPVPANADAGLIPPPESPVSQ